MAEESAAQAVTEVSKPTEEPARAEESIPVPAVAEVQPAEGGVLATESVDQGKSGSLNLPRSAELMSKPAPKSEEIAEEPAAKKEVTTEEPPKAESAEAHAGEVPRGATRGGLLHCSHLQ